MYKEARFPAMHLMTYFIVSTILLIVLSFLSAFLIHKILVKNIEKLLKIIYEKIKKSIANIR